MSPKLHRECARVTRLLSHVAAAPVVYCVILASSACVNAEVLYENDPAIVAMLRDLKPGASMLLPPVRVENGGLNRYEFEKVGPGQRDYCNTMPYAPERQTALYAGGNHQVPHRMNDVWEYHLGSNTWHMLYAPDGGNAGEHKGAYFLTSRTLVKDPDKALTEKEQQQIEAYRRWWDEHVHLADGHITTKRGGPVMPAHTWDAFTYDPRAKRLIWGMGGNPAAQPTTYARFAGRTLAQVEAQLDPRYTELWMFSPEAKRWIHYRTDKPHAALRGMGATMRYIPDLGKSIWYVAAQNVSPAAYEMWTFDAATDEWRELKPNDGKSIDELATKLKVAPMAEQQTAYSPRDRKLVAVIEHDVFAYDIDANAWTKACTDDRINAHDAKTVFAYDDASDTFLLANPRGEPKLASFSLKTGKWTIVAPDGPPIPEGQYGGHMGYYDPTYNVLVIQQRYTRQMWVYRHAASKTKGS